MTFTIGNPGGNAVSLTGVAFSAAIPAGLRLTGTATTNCTSGSAGGSSGGSAISHGPFGGLRRILHRHGWDQAALKLALRYRFIPARQAGTPVSSAVDLEVYVKF